ncbi:DNA primase [Streptomyces sp. RY43-2]|uniref:DNA primase n=1 Tax=Streptomyces macrolidinus TaxID=2952607 RepID=A0ABT0ZIW0_9ACTN|nr:DNA primase [Streptomyces macrolidinus]MCN9243480.1 DNA primase [Streptomyces macrolidinus]
MALSLAIGAGYVLGRTKKMKLALAMGSLVAGKRMRLDPRALANLVDEQLRNNPELKEMGGQLREDLRGAGSAASGALVERQIENLADRLHGRTERVREQLGAGSEVPEDGEIEEAKEVGDTEEAGEVGESRKTGKVRKAGTARAARSAGAARPTASKAREGRR